MQLNYVLIKSCRNSVVQLNLYGPTDPNWSFSKNIKQVIHCERPGIPLVYMTKAQVYFRLHSVITSPKIFSSNIHPPLLRPL